MLYIIPFTDNGGLYLSSHVIWLSSNVKRENEDSDIPTKKEAKSSFFFLVTTGFFLTLWSLCIVGGKKFWQGHVEKNMTSLVLLHPFWSFFQKLSTVSPTMLLKWWSVFWIPACLLRLYLYRFSLSLMRSCYYCSRMLLFPSHRLHVLFTTQLRENTQNVCLYVNNGSYSMFISEPPNCTDFINWIKIATVWDFHGTITVSENISFMVYCITQLLLLHRLTEMCDTDTTS